ncbi:MAG: dehydrogenase, partial [Acidimicrobiales bacterium]
MDGQGSAFRPLHHYYVGGNTKVYGAALLRMRERDFGRVRHVDGVSPAWPLAYGDLESWYSEAEALYSVHGAAGSDPLDPPRTRPYPYLPVSHEPRTQMLSGELGDLGLTPFPLPLGIRLDEADQVRSPC